MFRKPELSGKHDHVPALMNLEFHLSSRFHLFSKNDKDLKERQCAREGHYFSECAGYFSEDSKMTKKHPQEDAEAEQS